MDVDEALAVLQGKINHARDMLKDVDYSDYRKQNKFTQIIAAACNLILQSEETKKNIL